MLRAGATNDPDVAAAWREGLRRRALGLTAIAEGSARQGVLREGLDARRAADVAAAIVTEEVSDVLVQQRGWNFDAYEQWVAETLRLLLVGDPDAASAIVTRKPPEGHQEGPTGLPMRPC